MSTLAGKVALVTGSSQGIGAALALAAAGAKLVVSDIADCNDTARQIMDQGGEAIAVLADVTSNKSLTELVATAETALGPIDVLINNAGVFGTLELKPLRKSPKTNGIWCFGLMPAVCSRLPRRYLAA